MRRTAVVSLLFAAACAKGTATDVDARRGGDTDARESIDAADLPDAPPGTPDAAQADAAPGTPDAAMMHPDATVTPPDAATPPDAMVMPPDGGIVLGNGDTCATANEITAQATSAAGFTFSGDTGPLADDIEVPDTCTGYGNSGSDAVFKLDVAAGKTITASLTTPSWDGAVEIVPTCGPTPACLAGKDAVAGGGTETVTATAPTTSTYYIVVDSYDYLFEYGAYTLTVKVQ
ncbi:MAG: hypothetical protein K8W52_17045 [Deltaproteobacteria bacterium]|nr:hypothetical protein [Deltaproteobacteria bacterium]